MDMQLAASSNTCSYSHSTTCIHHCKETILDQVLHKLDAEHMQSWFHCFTYTWGQITGIQLLIIYIKLILYQLLQWASIASNQWKVPSADLKHSNTNIVHNYLTLPHSKISSLSSYRSELPAVNIISINFIYTVVSRKRAHGRCTLSWDGLTFQLSTLCSSKCAKWCTLCMTSWAKHLVGASLSKPHINSTLHEYDMWQSQVENVHYSYHILTTFSDFARL